MGASVKSCVHPRTGKTKVSYRSPAAARRGLIATRNRVQNFHGTGFYKCPHCDGWHLTKKGGER